jgi:hypothetical protein
VRARGEQLASRGAGGVAGDRSRRALQHRAPLTFRLAPKLLGRGVRATQPLVQRSDSLLKALNRDRRWGLLRVMRRGGGGSVSALCRLVRSLELRCHVSSECFSRLRQRRARIGVARAAVCLRL